MVPSAMLHRQTSVNRRAFQIAVGIVLFLGLIYQNELIIEITRQGYFGFGLVFHRHFKLCDPHTIGTLSLMVMGKKLLVNKNERKVVRNNKIEGGYLSKRWGGVNMI